MAFITDWLSKLELYEELSPSSAHFPESFKKIMLQNAVCEFDAFRGVKNAEQLEIAK